MNKKITERKIVYDINTGFKHFQTGKELDNLASLQHKHQDYEILIITGEEGRCFIAEKIVEFHEGDILCIGRNVPHCYVVDKKFLGNEHYHKGELLQFSQELFPIKMEELADFSFINNLLSKSQHGLIFRDNKLYKEIKKKVLNLDALKGITRVTELYKILDLIGKSKKVKIILPEKFDLYYNKYGDCESLRKAYNYLYDNFKKNITLEKIAEYVNLNPTALCRAFKRKTGITIFQFLIRLRVENACKLLSYSDLMISQIAYESGFNNIANFNRHFKQITKLSPKAYRKRIENIF